MLLRRKRWPRHERRAEAIPDKFRPLFDWQMARRHVRTDPEHEARMIALWADYQDWLLATSKGIQ